ncbi:MAG: hypothetical protein WBW33_33145 [Bryobacteraceae bacterium]
MNKLEFTLRLARESHRSPSQAADDVDKFVHRILKDLRRGNSQAPPPKTPSTKGQTAKEGKSKSDIKQSRS